MVWFGNSWLHPYSSGLLHWHWANHMIAPEPEKLPWWIYVNRLYEYSMNWLCNCQKTKHKTICAYSMGYTITIYLSIYLRRHCKQSEVFQLILNLKIIFHLNRIQQKLVNIHSIVNSSLCCAGDHNANDFPKQQGTNKPIHMTVEQALTFSFLQTMLVYLGLEYLFLRLTIW